MRLRERIIERAKPFLAEGEQVLQVFKAETGINPNWWSGLTFILNQHFVVVVTNKSVLILRASLFRPNTPTDVFLRRPRATRFGPIQERAIRWYREINLLPDRQAWVFSRFDKELKEADAEIDANGAL